MDGTARRLTRDRAGAGDLVAETVSKALNRLATLKNHIHLHAWMFSGALFEVLQYPLTTAGCSMQVFGQVTACMVSVPGSGLRKRLSRYTVINHCRSVSGPVPAVQSCHRDSPQSDTYRPSVSGV